MKNLLGIFAAVTLGIAIGAVVTHRPVKAQSSTKLHFTYESNPGIGTTTIPGKVVGFSCVEERVGSVGSTRCYIAYTDPE